MKRRLHRWWLISSALYATVTWLTIRRSCKRVWWTGDNGFKPLVVEGHLESSLQWLINWLLVREVLTPPITIQLNVWKIPRVSCWQCQKINKPVWLESLTWEHLQDVWVSLVHDSSERLFVLMCHFLFSSFTFFPFLPQTCFLSYLHGEKKKS